MTALESDKTAAARGAPGLALTYAASVLGQRWRLILLWRLHQGLATSAELEGAIPGISRKMLFEDLRALLAAGLIGKTLGGGRRPARHFLTARGQDLAPVLELLLAWGEKHRPRRRASNAARGG